ncbi:MAG: putative toxin-antitoxin system toxin component, PIN family [Nitrospinae bacterium]|nr:putative toxin-antitoxin system toxin component, PIN family [Nitrospinota bacterium]MBF0634912.1 putative toxin-antitoxin system toxin component, PIN family [Nitrospinota bacterium]
MRVVLDTNVIIAAFAARGLCAEVYEVCLANHTIVMSEHILSEVERNLAKKIRLPRSVTYSAINYLREISEIFEPELVKIPECRDKDDIKIIGTALSGGADIIITGDDDLLVLKSFAKVKILTPREFWDILRSGRT